MAVTRIKNNQITDSTITYTKIAAGTLVGSNFNQNLTLNSNISIVGNLTVTGVSSSINSTNTYVNDPLIVFNNGYTGSLAGYDIGMLVNRNLASLAGYGSVNTAWIWSETDQAFEAITTTDTGNGISTINNSGFANVKIGNLTAISGTFSGTVAAAILSGSHIGTAAFSTATATDFSTANAQISGGNVQGIAYLQASSFSTGNAVVTGGSLNAISIGATTPAAGFFTTSTTAQSVITGNASIGGNLSVNGNIILVSGNITTANSAFFVGNTVTGFNALYAGIPTGYTILPQVVAQFSENYNGYAQLNTQNINAGGDATTDYVATANNGSDTTYYVDLGINGSGFDPLSPNNSLGTATSPNDAYLYTQANGPANYGGNLVIGTTTDQRLIRFVSGGGNIEHVVVAMAHAGTVATSTTSGAMTVAGGVGITGDVYATTFQGNANSLYASITNLSSGNALITGGSVTGITGAASTLSATNFSSGNAQISGGNLQGIGYLQATNFSTGNAQVTGGSVTGITGSASTFTATNLSSGNVVITGGSVTGITGAATTLTATNFSAANAQITSGSVTNFNGQSNTFTATNFSTANARIDGGFIQGINTIQVSNFSSGNILVAGGSLTGVNGQFNTLTATNFSSGNIVGVLTGTASTSNVALYQAVNNSVVNTDFYPEFTDRYTTGNSASYVSAAFKMNPYTGIFSTSGVNITAVTPANSVGSGALVVTGGATVGGNLYVGNDVVVIGNLTVQGQMTALQSQTLDVTDLNITVAKGAINPAAANGAGITVDAANATLVYTAATDSWNFNKQVIGQFTTSNLQATGGSVTGITGSATTLTATDFSTANAQISGGNVQGIGYLQSTNLSAGNVLITSGSVTGITGSATTFTATNFSSGNIVGVLTGTASTANVALYDAVTETTNLANFYPQFTDRSTSGNSTSFVTPGITMNPGTNTIQASEFIGTFNGTAAVTSGTITGVSGSATNFSVTNFFTANADINGGTINTMAQIGGEFIVATNFYSPNVKIIGGNVTGIRGNAITFDVGGLTANSATIIGGNIRNITNLTSTNFFTANALITGGLITGVTVQADTLSVTNFSTANAVLSGGSIDSMEIGATTPSDATVVNLTVNGATKQKGNLVVASTTPLIDPTNAAFVIPVGGAAINGSAFIGGTLNVGAASLTTPLTNSSVAAVNAVGDFAQMSMLNTNGNGSADFSAYGDNGTDTGGWVDMGITGSAFNDPNYTFTKPNDGYVIVRPQQGFGGNLVLSTSEAGTFNDVVIGVGSFDASAEVARFHGNATTGGYFQLTQGTAASSTTSGALRVTGGVGITGKAYIGSDLSASGDLAITGVSTLTGNVSASKAVTINSSQVSGMDFKVAGVTSTNLIWARPNSTYDQVLIGNTATVGTLIQGAKLFINSTDSMMLPSGTSGQRPGNTGGTDTPGMFRYNTTLNAIEYFGGSSGTWSTVSTQFTLISDQQFSGTGSQTDFTLSSNQTTNNCIVSINGSIQLPTLAYSINANLLTFTTAPANGAVIDVRKLTTTNEITQLASLNGHVAIGTDNTNGIELYAGATGLTLQRTLDLSGAWVGQAANAAVADANTTTSVDAFAINTYRSAKYLLQATASGKYQVMEALVIHDGTTATITTYGIVQTNGNVGVLSASITGGNLNVNFIAANANTNVRVSKEYVLI
jgi:hypothetical protein